MEFKMTFLQSRRNDSEQNNTESNAVALADHSANSVNLQKKADLTGTAQRKPNLTGLPDSLKSGVENLSGYSMDNVRVHYNSSKPATVQALAYTQGTDIHVAPGQEQHLPHEAWHVAQQMAGRVQPTTNVNGMPVNDNAGLEHEADVMGTRAVQRKCEFVQAENTKENGGREVGNSAAQKKSNGKQGFGFVDNGTMVNERLQTIQLKIQHDTPSITPDSGRAGRVQVENIRGESYPEGYNNPTVKTFGWDQLYTAGHTLGNPHTTHYNAVKMHLWNGRLKGPGDNAANLAPGPANINSSMSAGPETAAKNAVDCGHRIWIDTQVTYQGSASNPADFTNVVPNTMKMSWGYMKLDDGSIADESIPIGKNLKGRGVAQAPAWQKNIDQPAGALTTTRINEYANLADKDTAGLKGMLLGASTQEKAQALDHVKIALKEFILLNYPEVFLNMDGAMRARILTELSLDNSMFVITKTVDTTNPLMVYKEIYIPLIEADKNARLQDIYSRFDDSAKKAQIKQGKTVLLNHLGDVAKGLVWLDYSLFRYLDENTQAMYMSEQAASLGGALLEMLLDTTNTSTQRKELLDNWAKKKGKASAKERIDFVTLKISLRYLNEYKRILRYEIRNDERFGSGKSRRSPRLQSKRMLSPLK